LWCVLFFFVIVHTGSSPSGRVRTLFPCSFLVTFIRFFRRRSFSVPSGSSSFDGYNEEIFLFYLWQMSYTCPVPFFGLSIVFPHFFPTALRGSSSPEPSRGPFPPVISLQLVFRERPCCVSLGCFLLLLILGMVEGLLVLLVPMLYLGISLLTCVDGLVFLVLGRVPP